MDTATVNNVVSYLFTTMNFDERQYLAGRLLAKTDEYGLLPEERVAVENYLTRRADDAVKRVDMGESYSNAEVRQSFMDAVHRYQAEV
jgi:hypothetical protein